MRKKILLVVLSSILIMSLLLTLGCVPKQNNGSPSPGNSPSSVEQDVASLKSSVNELRSKLASLPASQDYGRDIDSLEAQINDLQMQLDDALTQVDETLAAWEEEQAVQQEEEQEEALTDSVVRWNVEVLSSTDSVTVDEYHTPSRIEESDIYDMRLTVYNNTTTAINDLYLSLDFTPRDSSLYTYIDEKNTWLDSTRSPYIMWDIDVVTRGTEKYARRISFTSDAIKVPAGTLIDPADPSKGINPASVILQLEFSLEYKP